MNAEKHTIFLNGKRIAHTMFEVKLADYVCASSW
jgi:hypothetical protein